MGVMTSPVMGQEATDDGVGDVVATVAPVDDVTGNESGEQGTVDDLSVNVIQIVIGLLTAFTAGGVVVVGGAVVLIDRIRDNTATVTAMERLAESFPPGTRDLLLYAARTGKSFSELAEEVLDGEPILDKVTDAQG